MITDSITNASATSAHSAKDFAKKKRNNKSAKMKQNKLGLRREQWLSQVAVTNKVCKEEDKSVNPSELSDHRDKPVESLDGLRREEVNNGVNVHESFMESPSNSSMGGGTDISTNFSESRTSSSGLCSGNITDDDDDDDGCVDDWEALADALAAEEESKKENLQHESVKEQESVGQSAASDVGDLISDDASDGVGVRDAEQDCLRMQRSNRAWRPDDNLRPQGLPNLAKQLSFPELDKRYSSVSIPSSCPICYEELDLTDSSFLPCPCGFRLCLFCHKTICDGDGRCPGCRKPYEQNAIKVETSVEGGGFTIRLARSSSMFCRF